MEFRYCETCRLLFGNEATLCPQCKAMLLKADIKYRAQFQKRGFRFAEAPGKDIMEAFMQELLHMDEDFHIQKQTEEMEKARLDAARRMQAIKKRQEAQEIALERQEAERRKALNKQRAARSAAIKGRTEYCNKGDESFKQSEITRTAEAEKILEQLNLRKMFER